MDLKDRPLGLSTRPQGTGAIPIPTIFNTGSNSIRDHKLFPPRRLAARNVEPLDLNFSQLSFVIVEILDDCFLEAMNFFSIFFSFYFFWGGEERLGAVIF